MLRRPHMVWDWNGTLLDDLRVIVESVNVGIARLGLGPIDEDVYRDHFTRPVRAFYDALFDRPVSDLEWAELNQSFHDAYYARAHAASLSVGAESALAHLAALGWTQSVLSMSAHQPLAEMVRRHGLAHLFTLVEGLDIPTGDTKGHHLERHLATLGRNGAEVILIGDTPDDAVAARHVGARVILYDGGSHHPPTLGEVGAPVVGSLLEGALLAERLAIGAPSDSLR